MAEVKVNSEVINVAESDEQMKLESPDFLDQQQ